MKISPAYVHLMCLTCDTQIDIPVHLCATDTGEDEGNYSIIRISVKDIDMQPMYDHNFVYHMNLFDDIED